MDKETKEKVMELLSQINDKIDKLVVKLKEANNNLQNIKQ